MCVYSRSGACVQVSRKHLLEHVVPTLVSLKACLERAHSPLVRDVMEYFQVGLASVYRARTIFFSRCTYCWFHPKGRCI